MDLSKEVSRQETERSVPARQESTAPKSGELAKLEQALDAPAIKKVDPAMVRQVLKYAMVKIGLRAENWPAGEEKDVLHNHVLEEYGMHTTAEIRLAFDMAIAGKLDLEPRQIPCYENFSCLYFSTIMNSYRRWAGQEYKQIKELPPVVVIHEKTTDDEMETWYKQVAAKVITRETPANLIPIVLYDWARHLGKFDNHMEAYLPKAVDAKLEELKEEAKERPGPAASRDLLEFALMIEVGEFTGPYVRYLPLLAKQLILKDAMLGKLEVK